VAKALFRVTTYGINISTKATLNYFEILLESYFRANLHAALNRS